MTIATAAPLADIQSHLDEREVPIDRVGVADLRWPIVVLDRQQQRQPTVASVSMSVSLPHHFRGTHMSRFIEVLNGHRGELTMRTMPVILRELRERLEADSARMEVSFPYFLERVAPVSRASAVMDYNCSFVGESNPSGEDFVLGVNVPVTSLCPCSKAISDYGAHNQRGIVEVQVRSERGSDGELKLIWIEELVEVAETSASAPVYPLLKRADERHVTMHAYNHPAFVEDIVRNVAVRLRVDSRVAWFRVAVRNMESIHNHAAFAVVEWKRPKTTVQPSDASDPIKL
jgi:GTP cyclohydrolase IB